MVMKPRSERHPAIIGFRRVKDSNGDRVVVDIALRGITRQPVESQDLDQPQALRLLAAFADAASRVEGGRA